MTTPTWRALAARAQALGLTLEYGRHEASMQGYGADCRFVSWTTGQADPIILRTAVATALEQLEARR